jgi:hypothetical protein
MQVLSGPVLARSVHVLRVHLPLLVPILCRALEDPYHEIKKVRAGVIIFTGFA